MNKKRFITYGFLSTILFVSVVLAFNYFTSFQTLSISFAHNSLKAEIYPANSGDGADELSYIHSLVESVGEDKTVRLKKGTYIVKSPQSGDYKETLTRVVLESSKESVFIQPDYTDQKLNNLLTQESTAIHTAIAAKYRRIPELYTISQGKLFGQGEWYATTLVYKNQADLYQSDTLRIILHKDGDSWKVATTPPEIIISKVIYPDIPSFVIDGANNL